MTSTDTGVGKTVISGLLFRFLLAHGIRATTQKWVQTGCHQTSEDVEKHCEIAASAYPHNLKDETEPYVFNFPASPHLAASMENVNIDTDRLKDSHRILTDAYDFVIVEGSGGPMVPLNSSKLVVDIAADLGISALLITENRLGAINQVLSSVAALENRGVPVFGIIFNRISPGGDENILTDNLNIVEKFTGKVLGELPYSEDLDVLCESFQQIGTKIWGHSSARAYAPTGRVSPPSDTLKKDLEYVWHPYTQMKDCETLPPILIDRAGGVKLFDADGNFYYDTISSWWCNVHGHNHPDIKKAIKEQLDKIEHVLFAGFTHKPAVELAERLVSITPRNLTKVFYSDDGSTAVEVALKMSFQFWQNIGVEGKTKFLSLDAAYHGDTLGAMSVSGVDLFNKRFSPLFFDSFKAPSPYCYRCSAGREKGKCSLECLDRMEKILKENAKNIAAIILEPILMGAGGMIIYPPEYLTGVKKLSLKYGVHLILDEIAAGFGRTGKMFASEHAGVEPDIMCLSKGLTSGYLPIAATLTTKNIFDAFYDNYSELKTFYHGHTYTANPLACAAGIAAVGLFEKENTLDNVPKINAALNSFLESLKDHPVVGDIRSIGAVGAIELVKDKRTKEPFGIKERVGLEIYKEGLKNNLLLRPLGNIVYFFLPLSLTDAELKDIFDSTHKTLTKALPSFHPV